MLSGSLRQQVIEEQQSQTDRSIDLRLPADPVVVQADDRRVSQVVSNLVTNALKYSPANTPIGVEISQRPGEAILAVSNESPVLSQEQQKTLFEPFYRSPEARSSATPGWGLGLAICKEIVLQHSGPVLGMATPLPMPQSDPAVLEAAIAAIVEKVTRARTACILPGFLVARANLRQELEAVIDHSGLPFATMFNDKSTLDETHPSSIGMYDGQLMNPEVRAFVEDCDCVLGVGALLTDFNTGAFTARIDRTKSINILYDHVRVGHQVFEHVWMKDVLQELARRLPRRSDVKGPPVSGLGSPRARRMGKSPLSISILVGSSFSSRMMS